MSPPVHGQAIFVSIRSEVSSEVTLYEKETLVRKSCRAFMQCFVPRMIFVQDGKCLFVYDTLGSDSNAKSA